MSKKCRNLVQTKHKTMSNNKTYTEKELEVFTQLYSSNFEAKCVQEYEQEHHVYFDWKEFSGKKMKEKLEAFNKAINYPTPFHEEHYSSVMFGVDNNQ